MIRVDRRVPERLDRLEIEFLRLEKGQTDRSVQVRTSLHFLTPQNCHFLRKRERLFAPNGNVSSNPEISETERRAKSREFADFIACPVGAKRRETGLVG